MYLKITKPAKNGLKLTAHARNVGLFLTYVGQFTLPLR